MRDKKPRNEIGERHGYWQTYYSNGKIDQKGLWINGRQFGYHEKYYYDGELSFRGDFIDSEVYGYWENYFSGLINKQYYAR
jgi:antitoxin component YwqK of YwqJK toxin-antitoxin module